jgi:hypothetical protein
VVTFYRKLVDAYASLGLGAKIGLVVGLTLLTTAIGMVMVVMLPADHFCRHDRPPREDRRNVIVRGAVFVLKNALGLVFVPLGIVMAVPLVPGPGLVFLILGLSLLDFPGKRRLERWLLARPGVLRAINDLRRTFGKPPLAVDRA